MSCSENGPAEQASNANNLRERIAAALYRHCGKDSGVPDLQMPWQDAFPIVRGHWLGMADAVIRELELEPERRIGPGEPGEGLSGFVRYVTGWAVDE